MIAITIVISTFKLINNGKIDEEEFVLGLIIALLAGILDIIIVSMIIGAFR